MENLEINHNLLSAYIDNDVSEKERILIEVALENDPQIAWEVATLQHTVSMLNELSKSDLPLFTKPLKTIRFKSSSIKHSKVRPSSNFFKKSQTEYKTDRTLHQKFRLAQQIFWQLGSPLWRGIAIIGILLLLLLLGSDLLFSLMRYFKTFWLKAQNTTQVSITALQSASTAIGLGIHRTYLLIIYLIISALTLMSTMLWWRSNSYH